MDLTSIPQTDFFEPITIRLISTAYIEEPALKPLAESDDALDILAELEGMTSRRASSSMPLPIGLSAAELVSPEFGYGASYINAAFCYTRNTGNRFNGPDRGAWYATYGKNAAKTGQAEVTFHLTRELEATGVFDNITCYRELLAGFATRVYDLSGLKDETMLSPDPEIAYPAGQQFAGLVRGARGNGIVYPSARHKGGKCLVAMHPGLVQNIRDGKTWQFTWDGTPKPAIEAMTVSGGNAQD